MSTLSLLWYVVCFIVSEGSCVNQVRQRHSSQALASKARQVEGTGGDAGSSGGSASVRGSKVHQSCHTGK